MKQLKKTLLLLSLTALATLTHNAMAGVEGALLLQPGSKCEGWDPGQESRFVLVRSTILNKSNGNGKLDCGLIKLDIARAAQVGLLAIDNSTAGRVCARAIAYRHRANQPGDPRMFTGPTICTMHGFADPGSVLLKLGALPAAPGAHYYISVLEIAKRQGNRRSGVHSFGAMEELARTRMLIKKL